jgi:hypothetical protein
VDAPRATADAPRATAEAPRSTPSASSDIAPIAPNAAADAPTHTGARIAMFVARKTRAAAAAPPAAPASSPPMTKEEKQILDALKSNDVDMNALADAANNSGGLSTADLERRGNSCGMRAPGGCNGPPCGGGIGGIGNGAIGPPPVTIRVDVGLEPKTGLSKEEDVAARRAITLVRARITSCIRGDAKANGPSAKLSMSLDVNADGAAAPTVALQKSVVEPQTDACIRAAVVRDMSGDTTPAALVFPIWVDIVKK